MGRGGGGSQFMSGPQWSEFDAASGRITLRKTNKRYDAYVHDDAANAQFSYTQWWDPVQTPKAPREDRASFYGADDRLKQVDYRWVVVPNGEDSEWKRVVEVYRYDPLGRRILVRTFRSCRLLMLAACRMGTIRRTPWHGGLLEQREHGAHTLYKRNRHYDPATGRFTQDDPIRLAIEAPAGEPLSSLRVRRPGLLPRRVRHARVESPR